MAVLLLLAAVAFHLVDASLIRGATPASVPAEGERQLLVARGQALAGALASIVPNLHPKSDKAFFGHDYPNDMQPRKLHDFSHPAPIVQESDEYDKDFPKDENSDGGEWKAQFHYDTIRSRIHEARNLERMRKQTQMEAEAALKKAQEEVDAAEAKAAAARSAAEKDKDLEKQKEESLDAAKNKVSQTANGTSTKVQDAMKDVEAKMKSLEECKKNLQEAQDKLKKKMEESEAGKKAYAEVDEKTAAAIAAQEKHQKDAAEQAAAREKAMAEAEAKAKEQTKVYEQAKKEWSLTDGEVKELQGKLKKAEDRLREFRHKVVQPGGGIYYTDKDTFDPCAGCPGYKGHEAFLEKIKKSFKKAVGAGESDKCDSSCHDGKVQTAEKPFGAARASEPSGTVRFDLPFVSGLTALIAFIFHT